MGKSRFISQYPKYGFQARRQRVQPLGDGTRQVLEEGLYVQFMAADDGGMIYARERQEAEARFAFRGTQQEQDQATPVDLIHRLSVLDTEEEAQKRGWTAADLMVVEQQALKLAREAPQELILIEGPPVPAPYPNYDRWDGTAEDLVLKLTDDGFELGEVLVYEQNFGPKRADVIEALTIAQEAIKELVVHG